MAKAKVVEALDAIVSVGVTVNGRDSFNFSRVKEFTYSKEDNGFTVESEDGTTMLSSSAAEFSVQIDGEG